MPDHAGRETQRQIGHGPDIDVDNAELFAPVEFDRFAEQAEAGIVDEVLDFDIGRAKCRFDLVGGGVFELLGNRDAGQESGDLSLHVGVFQRTFAGKIAVAVEP